ncbi:MAG: alpha/beta hydrolase [Halioglobus sp.]
MAPGKPLEPGLSNVDSPGDRVQGNGPTLDELNRLRMSLPAFANGTEPSKALNKYLEFYHLQFSDKYPEVRYRAGFIPSGNFKLMTQRWLLPDAKANLVLVHGYFDHAGIYDKLVAYGLSRRCNVLIFDLPGHGLSSGDRAVIDAFVDYGKAIEAVLSGAELPSLPNFALGQSTGCAALMELARHAAWPFTKTALMAPLVRPAGWAGVRLGHSLLHRFTDSLERKFNKNSSDLGFLDFLRSDPLQSHRMSLLWIGALKRWLKSLPIEDLGVGPALVIQGRKDGTVDWRYNMNAIAQLFPGSDIRYLDEAGHQLANESLAIRDSYSAILDEYFFN